VQVSTVITSLLLVTGLTLFLPGCKTVSLKKDSAAATEAPATVEEAPAPEAMKIPVGTIHHVDPAGTFVLIRSSRLLQIEPGTILTVIDNQGAPVASVKVSPARKGQFLTADIVSGVPAAEQRTIMDHAPPAAGSQAPATGRTGAADIQVLE
jgi:hypothetical protein